MIVILYLVRHGETDWNLLRRIQGTSDIPLNKNGLEQAEKLAAWFRTRPVEVIFSSDLIRAKKTAMMVGEALDLPVKVSPILRERTFGELEGITMEEFREHFPHEPNPWEIVGKYGIESIEDMKKRMVNKLEEIMEQHANRHVLVVSHGGAINAFIHHITNGEWGTGKTKLENTSVSRFAYESGLWNALQINDTSHL